MKNCTFKIGIIIEINGQRFVIVRILNDGVIQLECQQDGLLSNTTQENLLQQYSSRQLRFVEQVSTSVLQEPESSLLGRPLSAFPDCIQEKAIRKKKYLDFILQMGTFVSTPKTLKPLIAACAQQCNDPNPPSAISLYRWYRGLVSAQRDHRALIDRVDLQGGCGSRLHPEVQALLQASVDQIYLAPERPAVSDVHFDIIDRIARSNEFRGKDEQLRVPSASTVLRFIRGLDKYEVTAARFGDRIARMRFRTSGRGARPQRILERVEIDHTPLDLFVIDGDNQLPMGRPTVTLATDVYSRMPMGIHIGFDGPSLEAVFDCLRNAILPKTFIRDRYPEITNDWPCFGRMEELICDNGLEFHSSELERVGFELGTILTFCPKRQPFYKGSVERFLKTLNFQFAHAMPGTSFARWFHREDYDPLKHSVITLEQLRSLLYRWLIDVYAQKLHRGIGTTPYLKWQEGLKQFSPGLPPSPERLDVALGRTCTRTLSHAGIELFNLRYNHPDLLAVRRQLGERGNVEVRYYAGDLSYVNIIDPVSKEPILVPALELEYARDLNLEQHRLICAHIRQVQKANVNAVALARAKAEIREAVREMAFSKSQKKRQRAAKIRGIGSKLQDPLAQPTRLAEVEIATVEALSADVSTADLPEMQAFILEQPTAPTFLEA